MTISNNCVALREPLTDEANFKTNASICWEARTRQVRSDRSVRIRRAMEEVMQHLQCLLLRPVEAELWSSAGQVSFSNVTPFKLVSHTDRIELNRIESLRSAEEDYTPTLPPSIKDLCEKQIQFWMLKKKWLWHCRSFSEANVHSNKCKSGSTKYWSVTKSLKMSAFVNTVINSYEEKKTASLSFSRL